MDTDKGSQHAMGEVVVNDARRPHDWDAYVWVAASRCSRCGKMLTSEYWLPSRLLFLIPSEKRDEAMRAMADFVKRRLTCFAHYYNDPELPLCEKE